MKINKLLIRVSIILSALFVLSFITLYYILFAPNTTKTLSFVVKRGYNVDSLTTIYKDSSALQSGLTLKYAYFIYGRGKDLKRGHYKIPQGSSNSQIIKILTRGLQTPVKLIIPSHIRSIERVASIISSYIEADSIQILESLNDSSFLKKTGFTADDLMGLIIPNTYEVYYTSSAGTIAERLYKEYNSFWNNDRKSKLENIGLTAKEAIILASIVSEESNIKAEQPTIAGVYMNRLKRGIPLQADPTIKFAIGDQTVKRILYKHLEVDSRYNTYKYRGLPPGAITIPPIYTIDAVLNYSQHSYLYFCADPSLNGTHRFSKTLQEHNKNARLYQRAISNKD